MLEIFTIICLLGGLLLFFGGMIASVVFDIECDRAVFIGAAMFVIGVGPALYLAVKVDVDKRNKFMTQCLEYKKEYECTAMWRAGENHTTVVPMPVIIGR